MTPDLSVIIVTYNGRAKALATLRSSLAATGSADVEWIVVDNGSTDGTPDAIEQAFPGVRLIRSENHGFAAGNNIGLRLVRGRYVLLLNPDVEILKGDLASLVAAMDARPEVGMASVVHRAPDGNLQPSIRRFPSFRRDLGESLFAARWPILRTMQELETRERVLRPRALGRLDVRRVPDRAPRGRRHGRIDGRALLFVFGGDRLVLPVPSVGLGCAPPAGDGHRPPLRPT